MITIKYIPNILSEQGRTEKHVEFCRTKSIGEYLNESGIDPQGQRIIVSGRPGLMHDHLCLDGDEIIVTPKIDIETAFLFFAGSGGGMLAFLWGVAKLAVVAYSVYSAVQGTRKPSYGGGLAGGLDESSPTYGWDGIRTTQDIGLPIPLVYGRHKVGGNIINAFTRYDGDESYLNMLLAVSEGEIESITDIKINDQPVANYDGVTTYGRTGTNSQSVVANFEDAHNVYDKNSTLAKDSAVVYTTADSDVEAIEIHLLLANGLYQVDSAGAVKEWAATYRVEYKLHAAGSYTDLGLTTITAKTRSPLRRVYRIEGLTAGQYDVRVTKTSDDSSLDPVKEGDLTWSQVDEIKTDDFGYPNTALLGIKALATDQLSGALPSVSCVVEGIKVSVPQVMNEDEEVDWEDYYWNAAEEEYQLISDNTSLTWDGSTYVTRWTRNPIWILKDLILNSRYGLGEFIDSSVVDNDLFLEMSRHCDELVPDGEGGYEKRFCLDVVIDSLTASLDLILQLCASFNGFAFYSEGNVKIRCDKEDDYVQMFNMGNIKAGSFSQSWKSLKEVPNVIEASFLDEDKDYEQETIAYIDEASLAAGDPMRKKPIRLFTTRTTQALRIARYMAKAAKYQTRTISFITGIEAIACQVGDVIAIAHDVPQWATQSGRVVAGAASSVTLDQEITIESGKSYVVIIQHADDTFETRTITNILGTATVLSVSAAFTTTPAAYEKYAVYESTIAVKTARILKMRRTSNFEMEIAAVEYSAEAYDDSEISVPGSKYSALDLTIPVVENLNLTEAAVETAAGGLESAIDVWFEKPPQSGHIRRFTKARIYISEDGNAWGYRGETTGVHFRIAGDIVENQQYYVRVVAVSQDGAEGSFADAPTRTITITGETKKPADVTSFLVIQNRDNLYFGWSKVPSPGIWYYEIRYGGSTWDSSQVLVRVNADHYISRDFIAGTGKKFFVKARSMSQQYSDAATEATVTVDGIPFENIIEEYSEQTAWSGTKSNTTVVDDNLEISSGQLSGTYVTAERDLGYVATFTLKASVIATIATTLRMNSSETLRMNDDPTLRLSGFESPSSWTLEIRTSEDDETWTDWIEFQQGDYKCRYFQLRLTLTRETTSIDLECSTFDYYADLPDIDDMGSGEVTAADSGAEITFVKEYNQTPQIDVQINSGDAIAWGYASLDTEGVTIFLYDRAGTKRTGTFTWKAHGI